METKPLTKQYFHGLAALIAVGFLVSQVSFAKAGPPALSRDVLSDKIRGAWAGQMIGVVYGAPTEFKSLGKINEGNIKGYANISPVLTGTQYTDTKSPAGNAFYRVLASQQD